MASASHDEEVTLRIRTLLDCVRESLAVAALPHDAGATTADDRDKLERLGHQCSHAIDGLNQRLVDLSSRAEQESEPDGVALPWHNASRL
jgi:hypothetical protein